MYPSEGWASLYAAAGLVVDAKTDAELEVRVAQLRAAVKAVDAELDKFDKDMDRESKK